MILNFILSFPLLFNVLSNEVGMDKNLKSFVKTSNDVYMSFDSKPYRDESGNSVAFTINSDDGNIQGNDDRKSIQMIQSENENIQLSSSFGTTSSFSFACMVKLDVWNDGNDGSKSLISKYSYNSGTPTGFYLGRPFSPSDGIDFSINDGAGNSDRIFNAGNIEARRGEWIQIGCSYNQPSQEIKIYVDGEVLSSKSITTDLEYTLSLPFYFFSRSGGTTLIDGHIDEVLYVERLLTDSEFRKIYNISNKEFNVFVGN